MLPMPWTQAWPPSSELAQGQLLAVPGVPGRDRACQGKPGGRPGPHLIRWRGACRWGADYMLKLQLDDETVVAQIGNGVDDHKYWRNTGELGNEAFPVYLITSKAPGRQPEAPASSRPGRAAGGEQSCARAAPSGCSSRKQRRLRPSIRCRSIKRSAQGLAAGSGRALQPAAPQNQPPGSCVPAPSWRRPGSAPALPEGPPAAAAALLLQAQTWPGAWPQLWQPSRWSSRILTLTTV
jgi:hypothetical protein